jgi:vancomycin permeability regulator SanA
VGTLRTSGWKHGLRWIAAVFFLSACGADFWVWWKGSDGLVVLAATSSPRIILVPGASVLRNGSPSPVLRQRIEMAFQAAREWPESRIVLSGSAIAGGYDEPLAMRKFLVEHGIDSTRLVLDREGRNTRSSIRNLGEPSGNLVVVSQRWHLPRAVWLARLRGWNAQGLIAGGNSPAGWENLAREHLVRIQNFWGSFSN